MLNLHICKHERCFCFATYKGLQVGRGIKMIMHRKFVPCVKISMLFTKMKILRYYLKLRLFYILHTVMLVNQHYLTSHRPCILKGLLSAPACIPLSVLLIGLIENLI